MKSPFFSKVLSLLPAIWENICPEPTFKLKGSYYFRTGAGGVLTIIYMVILLGILTSLLIRYLDFSKPLSIDELIHHRSSILDDKFLEHIHPIFFIFQNNVQIGKRVSLQVEDLGKIVEYKLEYLKNIRNDEERLKYDFQLKNCNEKSLEYNLIRKSSFYKIGYHPLCLSTKYKVSKVPKLEFETDKDRNQFEFVIKYCQKTGLIYDEKTDSLKEKLLNPNCDQMAVEGSQITVGYVIKDLELSLKNYSSPGDYTLSNYKMIELNKPNWLKDYFYYVQKVSIYDHTSNLISKNTTHKFYGIYSNEIQEIQAYNHQKFIRYTSEVRIRLEMSNKEQVYKRDYLKIVDILDYLGGISRSLFFFFLAIYILYNQIWLNRHLLKGAYNMDQKGLPKNFHIKNQIMKLKMKSYLRISQDENERTRMRILKVCEQLCEDSVNIENKIKTNLVNKAILEALLVEDQIEMLPGALIVKRIEELEQGGEKAENMELDEALKEFRNHEPKNDAEVEMKDYLLKYLPNELLNK